jgi:anti-sigma factor RsiW
MSDCMRIREDLGGYVLEALEPSETDAVRAHLAHCGACAAEHAGIAGLPVLLDAVRADTAPVAALPPEIEERLLDRVARDRRTGPAAAPPRHRRRRPRLAFAAAGLAGVVATVIGALTLLGGDAPAPKRYYVTLRASAAAPGAAARAALYREAGGTRVRLRVSGLPADPGVVYELVCERADGTGVSGGTFRVDASGRAKVTLTTAARVGEYERLRVVRRAGGLSAAAETADVLVGTLN